MSGHSKWSTIKHQKTVADQKRGAAFSKMAKAISIAAKDGPDPDKNFKLRLAIEKAKQVNMPKSNIERAIARGSGGAGSEKLEEVVYEGYGPGRIAVVVEAVTDNRNRTTSEIKNLFERSGGTLAGPGSVSYQFEKAGLIEIERPEKAEEAILSIIDLGVKNVEETEGRVEILTHPSQLEAIAGKLQESGFLIKSKELTMQPKSLVEISEPEKKQKVLNFMEALDELDDVQEVFANFDFTE